MLPGPLGARSTHEWQTPHGSGVGPCSQLRAAGQDAGARGLAAAARAAEQVGVVDPVAAQRLLQRVGDVLLPDDLGEGRRAVVAVEGEGHGGSAYAGGRLTTRSARPRPLGGGRKGPPAHPPEPTYPCCLPALGGFSGMTPREGSALIVRAPRRRPTPGFPGRAHPPVSSSAEDSHSGLGRTLGKRVGGNPSRVRIPHPPPDATARTLHRTEPQERSSPRPRQRARWST